MGKDQELVQAVKAEDIAAVQKLLQRPKPGKASECRGGGAGPGRALPVAAEMGGNRGDRHRSGGRGGWGPASRTAAPGPGREGALPGPGASPGPSPVRRGAGGRAGALDVPETPGGSLRSGEGGSPAGVVGRVPAEHPRALRGCSALPGIALPVPVQPPVQQTALAPRPGAASGAPVPAGGLSRGVGTGRGLRPGRAGGSCGCPRGAAGAPHLCVCLCAGTCVRGARVWLCLGAWRCWRVGVYPGIRVLG